MHKGFLVAVAAMTAVMIGVLGTSAVSADEAEAPPTFCEQVQTAFDEGVNDAYAGTGSSGGVMPGPAQGGYVDHDGIASTPRIFVGVPADAIKTVTGESPNQVTTYKYDPATKAFKVGVFQVWRTVNGGWTNWTLAEARIAVAQCGIGSSWDGTLDW